MSKRYILAIGVANLRPPPSFLCPRKGMAVPEKGVMAVLEKGMAVLEVDLLMLGTGPASKVEGVKGAMAMRIGTRGKMPSLEGPFTRTVSCTRKHRW